MSIRDKFEKTFECLENPECDPDEDIEACRCCNKYLIDYFEWSKTHTYSKVEVDRVMDEELKYRKDLYKDYGTETAIIVMECLEKIKSTLKSLGNKEVSNGNNN